MGAFNQFLALALWVNWTLPTRHFTFKYTDVKFEGCVHSQKISDDLKDWIIMIFQFDYVSFEIGKYIHTHVTPILFAHFLSAALHVKTKSAWKYRIDPKQNNKIAKHQNTNFGNRENKEQWFIILHYYSKSLTTKTMEISKKKYDDTVVLNLTVYKRWNERTYSIQTIYVK